MVSSQEGFMTVCVWETTFEIAKLKTYSTRTWNKKRMQYYKILYLLFLNKDLFVSKSWQIQNLAKQQE